MGKTVLRGGAWWGGAAESTSLVRGHSKGLGIELELLKGFARGPPDQLPALGLHPAGENLRDALRGPSMFTCIKAAEVSFTSDFNA